MKLIVATKNKGKLAEIQAILSGHTVLGQDDAGLDVEVEETGSSFAENALLKARAIAALTDGAVLADDSGLEVDALGGAPGIYTARYAGEGASDAERMQKLLSELDGVPDNKRTARFVCVMALVLPNGTANTFEGVCSGQIAHAPRGENGFGYDPIFLLPDRGKTLAELPSEEKNTISHRFRALEQVAAFLQS